MLEFTWFHEGRQARLAVAALFLLATPLSAQPDSRSSGVPSAGVAVMADDPRQLTIISGIIRRGREASGTQFLPGNTHLETALKPSDVLPVGERSRHEGSAELSRHEPAPRGVPERQLDRWWH